MRRILAIIVLVTGTLLLTAQYISARDLLSRSKRQGYIGLPNLTLPGFSRAPFQQYPNKHGESVETRSGEIVRDEKAVSDFLRRLEESRHTIKFPSLNKTPILGAALRTVEKFQICSTPTSELGHCRHVQHCVLPQFIQNINAFLGYTCFISGQYIGVCCPDKYFRNDDNPKERPSGPKLGSPLKNPVDKLLHPIKDLLAANTTKQTFERPDRESQPLAPNHPIKSPNTGQSQEELDIKSDTNSSHRNPSNQAGFGNDYGYRSQNNPSQFGFTKQQKYNSPHGYYGNSGGGYPSNNFVDSYRPLKPSSAIAFPEDSPTQPPYGTVYNNGYGGGNGNYAGELSKQRFKRQKPWINNQNYGQFGQHGSGFGAVRFGPGGFRGPPPRHHHRVPFGHRGPGFGPQGRPDFNRLGGPRLPGSTENGDLIIVLIPDQAQQQGGNDYTDHGQGTLSFSNGTNVAEPNAAFNSNAFGQGFPTSSPNIPVDSSNNPVSGQNSQKQASDSGSSVVFPGDLGSDVATSTTTKRPRLTTKKSKTTVPPGQIPEILSRLQRTCGLNVNTRIVGGEVAEENTWHWIAALMRYSSRKNELEQFCGGVLISESHIVTAAHCTHGFEAANITVRLGEYDFNKRSDEGRKDFKVARIINHANYKKDTYQNDIAILKLAKRVTFTDSIRAICLPHGEASDYVDRNATVVGWGTTSFGGPESKVLRQVSIPVWSLAECKSKLPQQITNVFLCAGNREGGQDACQGDSGGPLMLENSRSQWTLVGIVSWGIQCAEPGIPGVYTRVTHFLNWIYDNVE